MSQKQSWSICILKLLGFDFSLCKCWPQISVSSVFMLSSRTRSFSCIHQLFLSAHLYCSCGISWEVIRQLDCQYAKVFNDIPNITSILECCCYIDSNLFCCVCVLAQPTAIGTVKHDHLTHWSCPQNWVYSMLDVNVATTEPVASMSRNTTSMILVMVI